MAMADSTLEVKFTAAELYLILELLEQVRSELPREIHHTFSGDYRRYLVERARLVDGLTARLTSVLESAKAAFPPSEPL